MKGEGFVYQPKGKQVWMLAYYVGPPEARRRIRESARTRDENAAKRILARKLREAANAQDGIAEFEEPTHRRVTMDTLFDELLADYRRREIKGLHHVELRLAAGKPLRATFGVRRASSITTAEISRYVTARKGKNLANATVNREVELLRRAIRLAVKSGRIVKATQFPSKLPEKNARQGFFETGDFLKILTHLQDPLDDIARFAFETGWRRGMVLGMKWSHVDRQGGVVVLPDSKNDDPQSIPLDGELLAVIERRWNAREYRRKAIAGISEYLPPERPADSDVDVQHRVQEGARGCGAPADAVLPRLPADGGAQHDPGRRAAVDRDASDGPPVALDVRAVRHRLARRQARGAPPRPRVREDSGDRGRERGRVPEPNCHTYGHTFRNRGEVPRKFGGGAGT